MCRIVTRGDQSGNEYPLEANGQARQQGLVKPKRVLSFCPVQLSDTIRFSEEATIDLENPLSLQDECIWGARWFPPGLKHWKLESDSAAPAFIFLMAGQDIPSLRLTGLTSSVLSFSCWNASLAEQRTHSCASARMFILALATTNAKLHRLLSRFKLSGRLLCPCLLEPGTWL